MRALKAALLAIASACAGCAPSRPAAAPAWQRTVIGGDCDVSAVVALDDAKDLLSLALTTGVKSLLPLPVPSGKRLEACARLRPGSGDVESWLVVVRGVDPRVAKGLRDGIGLMVLPSGARVIGKGDGNRLFVFEETWVMASPAVADRMTALAEGEISGLMSLPSGTVAAITLRGEGARRVSSEHGGSSRDLRSLLASDLVDGSLELRTSGDGIEVVARARYASEAQADRAARAVDKEWKRVGDELAERPEHARSFLDLPDFGGLLAFSSLETSTSGNELTANVALSSSQKARGPTGLARKPAIATPAAPSSSYERKCRPTEHLDLDRRVCMENR